MAQCAATAARTGERCQAPAVTDQELCVFHRGRPAPEPAADPAADPPTGPEPADSRAGVVVLLGLAGAVLVRMLRG